MKINRLIALLGGVILTLPFTANAADPVALTTKNFPDQAFINYLTTNFKSNITTGDDGVQYIQADAITNLGDLTSDITDITGVKNFTNLTSINISLAAENGLTFADFRGISPLKTVIFGNYPNGGSTPTSKYATTGISSVSTNLSYVLTTYYYDVTPNNLKTLLLDGTSITGVYACNLSNLTNLSVKNCPSLKDLYLAGSNVMGLDFTGSTAIQKVIAAGALHLAQLNPDPESKNFYYYNCSYSNLVEVTFPTQYTGTDVSGSPNGHTLNFQNSTYLRKLNYSKPSFGSSSSPTVQFLLYSCALPAVGISGLTNSSAYSFSQNFNAGYICETNASGQPIIQIYDTGNTCYSSASITKYNTTSGSPTNCTIAGGVLTFTNTNISTSPQYSFSTGISGKAVRLNVTVNREANPLNLYLEYTDYNPFRNSYLNIQNSERIPFTLVENKNNTYSYTGDILGNFRIIQVNSDGSEVVLGANSAQVSNQTSSQETGFVLIELGKAYNLTKEQPALTNVQLGASNARKGNLSAITPYAFTTNPDEENGFGTLLNNATITVEYINGLPAGTLSVSGGTTTGVDDINVDNVSADNDEADAPIVYYDLQGRRVVNPSNGLFIKVQGSKSQKVYLK